MTRWRRIAARVVVFLILGVVINIAVAWGCVALALTPIPATQTFHLDESVDLSDRERALLGSHGLNDDLWWRVDRFRLRSFGARRAEYTQMPRSGFIMGVAPHMIRARGGWPFPALEGLQLWDDQTRAYRCEYAIPTGLRSTARSTVALPLQPIAGGFIINSVLYAVVLWLALFATFGVRGAVRRRRGRCPQCGYDLRGTPGSECSECGWERT